jgi:hypothetical protein
MHFFVTGYVEFENAGNHDGRTRIVFVLGSYVAKGLGTIDEETTASTVLLANYPVASAVLADHKQWVG